MPVTAATESTMATKASPNFSEHTGAKGGGQLGRTRDFLKECVEFRDKDEGERESPYVVGDTADADQKYAKSGPGAGKGQGPTSGPKRTGDKSLTTVKPRS